MPSSAAHVALAAHNVKLACLLGRTTEYHDWVATVTFYAALHVIEALFASEKPPEHGQAHERREFLLKERRKYSNVYAHYRPLQSAATIARYLKDGVVAFGDQMSPMDVHSILMRHHLVSILQSAAKLDLLPEPLREILRSAEDSIRQLPQSLQQMGSVRMVR